MSFGWLLCVLVFSITKFISFPLRFQKQVYQSLVFLLHVFHLSLKSRPLFLPLDPFPSPLLPLLLALPVSLPPGPRSLRLPPLHLVPGPPPGLLGVPRASPGLPDLSLPVPDLPLQLLDLSPQPPQLELVLREGTLADLLGQVDEAGTGALAQLVEH